MERIPIGIRSVGIPCAHHHNDQGDHDDRDHNDDQDEHDDHDDQSNYGDDPGGGQHDCWRGGRSHPQGLISGQ